MRLDKVVWFAATACAVDPVCEPYAGLASASGRVAAVATRFCSLFLRPTTTTKVNYSTRTEIVTTTARAPTSTYTAPVSTYLVLSLETTGTSTRFGLVDASTAVSSTIYVNGSASTTTVTSTPPVVSSTVTVTSTATVTPTVSLPAQGGCPSVAKRGLVDGSASISSACSCLSVFPATVTVSSYGGTVSSTTTLTHTMTPTVTTVPTLTVTVTVASGSGLIGSTVVVTSIAQTTQLSTRTSTSTALSISTVYPPASTTTLTLVASTSLLTTSTTTTSLAPAVTTQLTTAQTYFDILANGTQYLIPQGNWVYAKDGRPASEYWFIDGNMNMRHYPTMRGLAGYEYFDPDTNLASGARPAALVDAGTDQADLLSFTRAADGTLSFHLGTANAQNGRAGRIQARNYNNDQYTGLIYAIAPPPDFQFPSMYPTEIKAVPRCA